MRSTVNERDLPVDASSEPVDFQTGAGRDALNKEWLEEWLLQLGDDPTRIALSLDPTTTRMSGTTVHGNIPFDMPLITNVAHNLWQGGCEDGMVLPPFIQHVVSLYPWERYVSEPGHALDSFLEVRMYDSPEQSLAQVDEIARLVNERRESGPVLVHCQAGLNRSAVVVTRAIMLDEGASANDVIESLRKLRSPAVLCNHKFEVWLRTHDDDFGERPRPDRQT
jgi:protein-tyrosine phosphatase